MEAVRWAHGNPPSKKARPQASDYDQTIETLINLAVRRFFVKIYKIYGFPDTATATSWAQQAWTSTCKTANKRFSEVDSERIVRAIVTRASSARTHLRDKIRKMVCDIYRFNMDASKKSTKDTNIKLYNYLREGKPMRFCYKNWDDGGSAALPTGLNEPAIIFRGLQAELFKNHADIGIEFHAEFNPLPLPTIALMLTILEYGIESWRDGVYNADHAFTEKLYHSRYTEHLKQVNEWAALNEEVCIKIRSSMFKRILRLGNIQLNTGNIVGVALSNEARDRARAEMATRTGETDSENEG
ncbi:hypothetical protein EW026_g8183 [Hermanssonia centrifuga]|uniref:DUF6532 domain-containing protein n=1 Tax=Hermanssonia centrifuga TaxID=98765 RepID=A0A4S4K669_9APHY|nr:hypothetical protein EW026_g8183 [Hermanssonia centrifuga]